MSGPAYDKTKKNIAKELSKTIMRIHRLKQIIKAERKSRTKQIIKPA